MNVTHLSRAKAFAERVVAGEEGAGKFERLFAQRFLDDLQRQGVAGFPYVFDERAGAHACTFLELLPHIKGKWARPVYVDGQVTHGRIELEEWQVLIVLQLFGWKHVDTGLRRFRRLYLEVARKNAKSTLAAGILLYMLTADGEPGANCYSAATTGEQAREVFDVARNMVARLPEFQARFGVDYGKHDITVPSSASSCKPLNAEGSTLDGLNIHCAVVDELHAHKTRAVYDVIDSATGARDQALILMITTAGSDRSGICYEKRGYTIKVLERTLGPDAAGTDDSWLGVIYTLDDGDLWHEPKVWRKANPNLGVSVQQADMEAASREALATPSAQANFLTKRLNVWVNSDSAWMDMQAWDRCAAGRPGRLPKLTLEEVKHLPCWPALDLASKVDVAAKVRVFYDAAADHYYVIPTFWLPERAVQQGRNSQYDGWRRSGHLQVTEGEVIDFDQIEDDIRGDVSSLNVQEFPYDPHQATQLAGHMLDEGAPMVEIRPLVLNFSEPMKFLEALVLTGKLTHDGNPVMTWMMSNVVCHRDAKDNIYPRKERDENKIDGPVALIMGIARSMKRPEASLDQFLANPIIVT
jgi:phage terminase large subunit-like protein